MKPPAGAISLFCGGVTVGTVLSRAYVDTTSALLVLFAIVLMLCSMSRNAA